MTGIFAISRLQAILQATFLIFFSAMLPGCYKPEPQTVRTQRLHVSDQVPTVAVRTTPLWQGTMEETVEAYGRVIPLPGHVQLRNVLYEAIVRKILVVEGEAVSLGKPLIEMAPSPTTQLQLDQARLEHEAAKKKVRLVRQRMDFKLATQRELVDAQQVRDLAQGRMQTLLSKGIDGPTILKATSKGVVWKIRVQPGEIVPAGTVMLAMVPQGQEGVIVGVEPENIGHIRLGQKVGIKHVNATSNPAIPGKISLVTQQINPNTRLIDVLVQPDSVRHDLLLNDYVTARIVLASREALIAPRNAVLADDEGYSLFTVENGHAVRHHVRIGLESSKSVEILSENLHAGMRLVVTGNYELKDGTAVREEAGR